MPGANCLDDAARDEVEAALAELRRGRMVLVVDEDRENEGGLIGAGREGRGIAPDPDDISYLTTTRTRMDHQLGGGLPADGPPTAPVTTVEEVS
ncbi:3,4-dihydroxy-2-butanone-4-phosphate synthase [Pseudonocardia parietis]|uniref:3,4-dihydroxy-2-butanone-4-phosphate synthase n=1 Tax=Pseudonocardia parietis TaxID=570936 RepID=A0ABS4VML9_9PSEU|nr:3,4-dihydroxy-2-butanone-4-phosphate synthase [Pseudonocardia parietis]MBP2365174.1 hypothetical protein [Pseudonocardia parietis]